MAAALSLFLPDADATAAMGGALAGVLAPGQVITLSGALGAGKSALARAIIRARRGSPDLEVPSPSFALVQPYGDIVHADLYRLGDESEIEELGLLEADDAILIVEWPERAPVLFSRAGYAVTLTMGPDEGRSVAIAPQGQGTLAPLRGPLAPWTRAP